MEGQGVLHFFLLGTFTFPCFFIFSCSFLPVPQVRPRVGRRLAPRGRDLVRRQRDPHPHIWRADQGQAGGVRSGVGASLPNYGHVTLGSTDTDKSGSGFHGKLTRVLSLPTVQQQVQLCRAEPILFPGKCITNHHVFEEQKRGWNRAVPISLRKSTKFRSPLCDQLFLCFSKKIMIFDHHFLILNDGMMTQKWLRRLEAFKDHHSHSQKRLFLFICAQLFTSICG